jgi:signal transduction histidine kinase
VRNQRVPEFLGRAIGNLLDNAVRASPAGVPVRLHVAKEESRVRVTIEDEGPGIPEELRTVVFEAGVSTRPEGEGSGVGLTVAAEILDMLGGSVSLDPRGSGPGTRATLRLPLTDSGRS